MNKNKNERVNNAYTEEHLCPVCKKKYVGFPAISRRDNKTRLCPECGQEEAILYFSLYMKGQLRRQDNDNI